MPAPPRTPTTFLEVLEQVWLETRRGTRSGDAEWSAKLGALEALEAGCHHPSSPSHQRDRGVVERHRRCCTRGAVVTPVTGTDRSSRRRCSPGTRRERRPSAPADVARPYTRCSRAPGHADAGRCGRLAVRHGVGVHVHVAEGPDDVEAADRLRQPSTDQSLIHGVHLPTISSSAWHDRAQPAFEHDTRRRVRPAEPIRQSGWHSGTDGIGADMVAEFQLAFVAARADDVATSPDTAWGWLEHGGRLRRRLDDRVRWSYVPMDPRHQVAHTTGAAPDRRRHRRRTGATATASPPRWRDSGQSRRAGRPPPRPPLIKKDPCLRCTSVGGVPTEVQRKQGKRVRQATTAVPMSANAHSNIEVLALQCRQPPGSEFVGRRTACRRTRGVEWRGSRRPVSDHQTGSHASPFHAVDFSERL